MKRQDDPILHGRRLRIALREARLAAGLSQAEAARLADWSISKMRRIETGRSYVSTPDMNALMDVYGIGDEDQRRRLTTLARKSRWRPENEFQDVHSQHFLEYRGYEASAERVLMFEPLVVPGLLQTEAYMRAIIRATSGRDFSESEIKRRIRARVQRQAILTGDSTPMFHFILDEAVIRRKVGQSTFLMRNQLAHIRSLSERPNVEIQVLPFSAGEHPGLAGPFVYLKFSNASDGDLVFLERGRSDLPIKDSPIDTQRHLKFFRTLERLALSSRDSYNLIAAKIEAYPPEGSTPESSFLDELTVP